MSNDEKCGNLNDLSDILIVQKVKQSDHSKVPSNADSLTATQCLCFRSGCDCEINQLAEEQEAIKIKQYQMLQADERGKQALIKEISALKQKQEERAEILRNRQQVLDAEKERSKKIASLPPPLPKSVKLLLKQCNDEPKTIKSDILMPDELTAVTINPAEHNYENKENVVDPKELEAKQKMQEEWQMKAKRRFNEALKKDCQKQEFSNVMKQIQNAELLNRREMAKNISSEKKGLPCTISDKLQFHKVQAHLEDAAEKAFRKTGTKEHIIEEMEGYQDHYEEKYKKIDSNYEVKMTDCIPSFIKENYEYLLEEESKFHGGRNFSGLDDDDNATDDILNLGYIESPPTMDEVDGSEKIDLAISNLDKLRSNLQEEYEQTVKPILLASIEVSKKELSDKAVETELFKVSLEDKAIETDEQLKTEEPFPKTPPIFDYKNAGIMAHRRRPHIQTLRYFQEIPNMHKRDVRYVAPSTSLSGDLGSGSWSSSSYCSLPSKHGIPTFTSAPESVKCDICVAEREKYTKKDFPDEISQSIITQTVGKSDESVVTPSGKAPLSKYVKKIAEKYFLQKTTLGCQSKVSNSDVESPAFEKEVIGKTQTAVFEQPMSKECMTVTDKCIVPQKIQSSPIITDKSIKVIKQDERMSVPDCVQISLHSSGSQDDLYSELKNFDSSTKSPEYSDYQLESKKIQAINEVLSRKLPRFTLDSSPKFEESKDEKEPEKPFFLTQNVMDIKNHIYHELSTIQELDSALTNNSLQLSQSKLPNMSAMKTGKELLVPDESKSLVQSTEKIKIVSLLDPLDSHTAELARSIHFVPETGEKGTEAVSSEALNVMSVSSKDEVSLPSYSSGSNASSISSLSSGAKIFSSTLVGNRVKHPHLKDVKSLPIYFKDISDIQKKISNPGKSNSLSYLTSSEFLSCTPESTSSQSISSVHVTSKENKNAQKRLMSGYSEVQNLHELEIARSVVKPNNNLRAISSTSSSTENLSEISGSKVVHQSTPVKRFSELIQEPGILDEPDLTLMTTDLTCEIDSTAIPRDLSVSIPSNPSAKELKNSGVPTLESDCKTPSTLNLQNADSPDTPSMLSFLQHERSCKESDESSPDKDMNLASGSSQSQQRQMKDVKRSLFQKADDKQRTKRLWNNLEEVRKKNLSEERRQMMEINRKKAKEYAKKLTPKPKRQ